MKIRLPLIALILALAGLAAVCKENAVNASEAPEARPVTVVTGNNQ